MEYDCMVSVHMLVYQHAGYIRQALDSVLIQKVNFRYEIVIGDDCSTDGTQDILKEYKKKYPDKIHLLLNKKNIGAIGNSKRVKKHCRGKYIAYLEGDDFWTDDTKLQIQVDFLEQNPEYAACYHGANVIGNDKKHYKIYRMARYDINSFEQYFSTNPSLPTASLVMKNIFLENDYFHYYKTKFIGDKILHVLILKHGKIKYIDRTMCTYRFITNSTNSYSSQSFYIRQRDYLKALEIQREIAPESCYGIITKIITKNQANMIKSLTADRLYRDALHYWWIELDIKEKINLLLSRIRSLKNK